MLPPVGYIIQRIQDHFDEVARQRMAKESQALLERPAIHPEKESFTVENPVRDGKDVQRIILESKASGAWGPSAIAPAKAALAARDGGKAAATQEKMHDATSQAINQ